MSVCGRIEDLEAELKLLENSTEKFKFQKIRIEHIRIQLKNLRYIHPQVWGVGHDSMGDK